jgi:lysophospholipase L1-like esterase
MRDADGNRLDEIHIVQELDDNAAATVTAQSTADGAATAAATAQGTATAAGTAAATAQAAADVAQADADTAQTTADNAQTAAGAAQSTADTANTAAGTAQTTATNAGNAASAAQSTANSAGSAAATAQADIDAHEADLANPHQVTATQVGLGNVSNTSDATKQVANDKRFLRSPGPGVIGQIGASITSNGSLSFYDRALSGAISYGNLAIMGNTLPRTKGRFTAGGVAATVGFTTAQMIATHLPTVLLSNWDYCIIGEVTNDLGNGVAIATTRANVTTMVDALFGAGILPILTTVPPNDSYTSGAGLTWITQYNEWVKRYARDLGVPLVDYHSVLVNPSTNAYVTGYTSDGTHPVALGVKQMSDKLTEVLNSIPGPVRSPVEGAYNPNLLIPDLAATSAGSDKVVGSGNTTGGWCFASMTSTRWRGNSPTIVRGSVGDYSLSYPVTAGAMAVGHRVRLGFNIDAVVPTSGTISAYLYNNTQSQVVAGLSALAYGVNDGTSVVATDAAVTSGSNLITCATSKPFRANMIGNDVAVLSGVSSRFAAGTTIIGVGADGQTAYASANASASVSAQTLVVKGVPQACAFEFDVQSDMVGDTFNFIIVAGGAAGSMVSASQVTLADLTALGAV